MTCNKCRRFPCCDITSAEGALIPAQPFLRQMASVASFILGSKPVTRGFAPCQHLTLHGANLDLWHPGHVTYVTDSSSSLLSLLSGQASDEESAVLSHEARQVRKASLSCEGKTDVPVSKKNLTAFPDLASSLVGGKGFLQTLHYGS